MKIIHLPSGGKFYETPSGLFPSVTTVLQATMPEKQRRQLREWHERNGSEAESLRQQAAERGKVIHKLIEARFKGEEMECPSNVSDFWQEARRILGAIGEVLAVEQPVYHPQLQYAGTLDLLAHWQGVLTLFDFKTSHREKRSQWLTDAKLQIAAYRKACGTEISQGLIMVITPKTVQIFTLEREELEEYEREWLLRLQQYQNLSLYGQLFDRIAEK
jgi:ATP-dependent exoDNAse (exonuclease V) beta subunit